MRDPVQGVTRKVSADVLWRAGALVLGVFMMGSLGPGCSRPPDASTAESSTSEAPSGEAASPVAGTRLSQDLAACAPPPVGSPWTETGRASDGADTVVLLEPGGAGRSPEWDPAVLRISGDTCTGYVVFETDSGSDSSVRPPSEAAWDELVDESFAWHVAQSGGVEAYADIQRAYVGGALVECPPDDDLGPCLQSWLAQRFRTAGVEVAMAD